MRLSRKFIFSALLHPALLLISVCSMNAQVYKTAKALKLKTGIFTWEGMQYGVVDTNVYVMTRIIGNADTFRMHEIGRNHHRIYPPFLANKLDTVNAKRTFFARQEDTIYVAGGLRDFRLQGRNPVIVACRGGSFWDTLPNLFMPLDSQVRMYGMKLVNRKLFYVQGPDIYMYDLNDNVNIKSPIRNLDIVGPDSPFKGHVPKYPVNIISQRQGSDVVFFIKDSAYLYRSGIWLRIGIPGTVWQAKAVNDTTIAVFCGDTMVYLYRDWDDIVNRPTYPTLQFVLPMNVLENCLLDSDGNWFSFKGSVDIANGRVSSIEGIEYTGWEWLESDGDFLCAIAIIPPAIFQPYEILPGAPIKGKVYWDKNLDCNMNGTDEGFPNMRIGVYGAKDSFVSYSGDSGNFKFTVPKGSYTVAVQLDNSEKALPFCTHDTLIVDNYAARNKDIVFLGNDTMDDVSVDFTGYIWNRLRQGFQEHYVMHVFNKAYEPWSGKISLHYPDTLVLDTASVPWNQSSNGRIQWSLNLKAREKKNIDIYFTVPTSIPVGRYVKFRMNLDSADSDNNHLNDTSELIQQVRAAYDPNSKHSTPEGVIYEPVSEIKYHINFQNIGTDTAYRVVVVDSFTPNFPLYKLQMTGASHPYDLRVEKGNVLVWVFDNIKLPPLSENARTSMGFISFYAPLREPTKAGTVILNRAHIYFDYQKPVITYWDTVKHDPRNSVKIISKNLNQIRVFPNPGFGNLHVEANKNLQHCVLYSTAGAKLKEWYLNETSANLRFNEIQCGLYLLTFPDLGETIRIIKE